MYNNIYELASQLVRVGANAGAEKVPIFEAEIYSIHKQMWADTSCGFGGMAGQAITNALTIVIEKNEHEFWVFHGGQLAYKIKNPNKFFFQDIASRQLKGKCDHWRKYIKRDDSE